MSSCVSRRCPAEDSGEYWPAPKTMWRPTVNARAFTPRAAPAAAASVWTRSRQLVAQPRLECRPAAGRQRRAARLVEPTNVALDGGRGAVR